MPQAHTQSLLVLTRIGVRSRLLDAWKGLVRTPIEGFSQRGGSIVKARAPPKGQLVDEKLSI